MACAPLLVATPEAEPLRLRQFAPRNLSVLDYAQGFTMWHYRGHVETIGATRSPPIKLAEVGDAGFFDAARGMIQRGDMIAVSALDGGALLYVTAVDPTVVVVPMASTPPPATP